MPPGPAPASLPCRCRSPRSARTRSRPQPAARPGMDGEVVLRSGAQLALGVSSFALAVGLADAQDRLMPGIESRGDLQRECPVCLAEQARARCGRAPLRERRSPRASGADTSPVKAPESSVHVLGEDLHPRAPGRVDHRLKSGEGRADRDLHPVRCRNPRQQRLDEFLCLRDRLVHLPVACHDRRFSVLI